MKAYADGFRTIIFKGSARSSKTVSIIQGLDIIATLSPKHKKLSIVSQSYPHLRDGVIYEYLKYQRREGVHRLHNKTDHEFLVNQSIINYFDGDPVKAIGPGRDICYINECNKGIVFTTYNDLKTRTTECVVMDYNPSGHFWLHEEENKILGDSRTIVLHSTWLDNIVNLTKEQIQDFIDAKAKSKTSDYWNYWWKVYGLGEDAVLMEERIMPFIKRVKSVPDDAIEIPSALDFGFYPDPTVFCRLWIKRGELRDSLYIKQVVYDQRLSINSKSEMTTNLVDLLASKGHNPKHLIIAESASPSAIHELRGAKFNVEAVKKTGVETSIRLFHDYDIFIVDGSESVFKEFDNYKYFRNPKGILMGVPAANQADHAIDGVRYVLLSRNFRWSLPK